MASRVLLRRVSRTNYRIQRGHHRQIRAPVACVGQVQQLVPRQMPSLPQSYSQIRSLCTKRPGEGMVINIQDKQDFEDRVINSKIPVVVDFHASWCGPCKLLGPRLESLVGAREGKVILAKIDVDEVDDIVARYRISSVPTVMAFRNQEKVDEFIGLKDDDIIETFLDKLIG